MVTVGFSPRQPLRELAEHLGLTGPILSDEHRVLYRLLGLRRAPLWRVYSPGTLALYWRAGQRGLRLPMPVEDTRQLGGDALMSDGVIVRSWAPRSPDDRVAPARVLTAALALTNG
jgi:hypothetical protein